MKRTIVVFFALLTSQIAQAIPCGTLLNDLEMRTYKFYSEEQSIWFSLWVAAFQRSELPPARRAMLPAGATVTNAFSVTDIYFYAGTTEEEEKRLQRYNYAATVSLANAPDQCFFVWFSDTSKEINVIIEQQQSGNLVLGSNNKLDKSVYLTLQPYTP